MTHNNDRYLFFDEEMDGGKNPTICCGRDGYTNSQKCAHGSHSNVWVIASAKPSITALQDLDGDGTCASVGSTINQDTSGSPTPHPAGASALHAGRATRVDAIYARGGCGSLFLKYIYIYFFLFFNSAMLTEVLC